MVSLNVDNLNVTQYYSDLEVTSIIDIKLNGQLLALKKFFSQLSWNDHVESVMQFLPLNGNAVEALIFLNEHTFPEVKRLLNTLDEREIEGFHEQFWDYLHPRIREITKSKFESGFYADAIETALKEVNLVIKNHVLAETGQEYDGARLMTKTFSREKPIIKLAELDTETGRNIQQGYMNIYLGAMIGIRNPKAHHNFETDKSKAIHLLFLTSLLMIKYDERI